MTSQETLELQVQARTTGKHWSRKLRRERQIPAVAYGPKIQPMNFSISEIDVVRYSGTKYENSIFVLKSENSDLNGLKVLKKVVDTNPRTHRAEHLDFYALDMTQTVRVNVEVRYEGKSEGEREGGVFNAVRREVEVECLPTEIPEFFEIDISEMQLNGNLHVSDLKIPDGIKLLTDEKLTLATVAEVKEEEVAPAAEAAAEGAEGAAAPAEGGGDAKAEGGGDAKAEGGGEKKD